MLPRQSPRPQQQAPADTTVSLASWGPDPPPYRITHRFPLQRILPPVMSSPPPCHHHPLHHHPWATHVGSQDSRCESYPTRQPWTKLSHGLPRPWWWSWVVLDVGERGACYRSSCSPFLGHRRGGSANLSLPRRAIPSLVLGQSRSRSGPPCLSSSQSEPGTCAQAVEPTSRSPLLPAPLQGAPLN
jgi:hypothetical protein